MFETKAKVQAHGLAEGKKAPYVYIDFILENDEKARYMGSLSETVIEKTIKTLNKMGYTYDSLDPITKTDLCFDPQREYNVGVETETKDGKTYFNVRWVEEDFWGSNSVSSSKAKEIDAQYNIGNWFKLVKSEQPSVDDIPF